MGSAKAVIWAFPRRPGGEGFLDRVPPATRETESGLSTRKGENGAPTCRRTKGSPSRSKVGESEVAERTLAFEGGEGGGKGVRKTLASNPRAWGDSSVDLVKPRTDREEEVVSGQRGGRPANLEKPPRGPRQDEIDYLPVDRHFDHPRDRRWRVLELSCCADRTDLHSYCSPGWQVDEGTIQRRSRTSGPRRTMPVYASRLRRKSTTSRVRDGQTSAHPPASQPPRTKHVRIEIPAFSHSSAMRQIWPWPLLASPLNRCPPKPEKEHERTHH